MMGLGDRKRKVAPGIVGHSGRRGAPLEVRAVQALYTGKGYQCRGCGRAEVSGRVVLHAPAAPCGCRQFGIITVSG